MKTMIKLALAAGLGAGVALPVAAQTVEEFYRGNQVRVIVGYSPGGGYDVYARLLARYIGRHLPGNPDVIVENMPGAGSVTLTNWLANVGPRDGTVIGAVSRGVPVEPMLGMENVQFDPQTLTWIGSMTDEVSVCAAWHESGITDWESVMEGQEFIVGGTGATSDVEVFTRMLTRLFDANLTLISGYPGGAEISLATEQGEVQGRCGWSWSSIVSTQGEWLENDQLNIILQLSLQSSPDLEHVPLVTEFAETEEELQVLQLVLSRLAFARPFVSTPDIPEDRAAALRQAFMDAATDPELIAEAEAQGLELNPMSGEDVAALIADIYDTPEDVIARTREIVAVQQ